MELRDELYHHGIKGQKWGIKNGPPYPIERHHTRNTKEVNDIFDSLTKKEKYYVVPSGKKYYSDGEDYKKYNLYSDITVIKNLPISVFDIWNEGGDSYAEVSLMTRNKQEYRGKGYAKRAAQRGVNWLKNHPEITQVGWTVHKSNIASQEIAKRAGFKHYPEFDNDEWLAYYLYPVKEGEYEK